MDNYIIDFTKLKHDSDFWPIIHKSLDVPEWCGSNFSALWDMLTGYLEAPMKITVIGVDSLPPKLDWHRETFLKTLKKANDDEKWCIECEIIS